MTHKSIIHLRLCAILLVLFISVPSSQAATILEGTVVHVADGDTITVLDSDKVQHRVRIAELVTCGLVRSVRLSHGKEEPDEGRDMSLREPFKSGPYRVEITQPCFVQGMQREPGETISLGEEDAQCLERSTRGRIVGRPPEEVSRKRYRGWARSSFRGEKYNHKPETVGTR